MKGKFGASFCYKVIYVFEINAETHKGLLKVGDASLYTESPIDSLPPNSKELNQAAMQRIKQYTNTVGLTPKLLHTELAVRTMKDPDNLFEVKPFRDHDVHRVLVNSGVPKKQMKNSTGKEWFDVDLDTVKKAIEAVKKGQHNFINATGERFVPIVFRPEQEDAIAKTLKQFKTGDRMLWNAKMRFGKTLSALQVVKEAGYSKTVIITHRPVVDKGWYEDFGKIFYESNEYIFGSKSTGTDIGYLISSGKKFVYFASIQDLRGSATIGGKFEKNDAVFSLDWDLVIVDEAHEGTTTVLGDDVIKTIVKGGSKRDARLLALSGTPFNILKDYEDNVYTWDYVMEQRSKRNWDAEHFGDSNPYDELPELRIYTYDLGKIISEPGYVELEDKAFNFREFFRTWTGSLHVDRAGIPEGQCVGDFYHEADVWSFLNLITKDDDNSSYPYSNDDYRSLFRHSLWMVPGVREALALSKLLKKHPVFGSGAFKIVNVAGDGDEEEKSEDALKKVKDSIAAAGDDGYTITLSCGKLTTGVTVPEWTAVFMLSGSFSTSASSYLQTIFRVQSPCKKNGQVKQSCFVFDFAPDRTLKMVAEAAALSTKAGKATESDKVIMGEFLNYCPVISVSGTEMKQYDTNNLLQQLKRAYAERVVQNGFDDVNLYNDELLKLDKLDLESFKELKAIVGASKAAPKTNEIDINRQGFTGEEYEEIERIEKKKKTERSPEEEARLQELKKKNKQKNDAISILRGISIRMPLLIYGADVNITEDITIRQLPALVDDKSWVEFMPKDVTKAVFGKFIKYYDPEVFIAAGRRIRAETFSADSLSPLERVRKITALFSCFKNPDKETVLTPWRVVNMHMSDCLGGYDFFNEAHSELVEEPRFVDRGDVTAETFGNPNAAVLEINSKTGLYPLYVTYSIFRAKCAAYPEKELDAELQEKLWDETVHNNVFVICKTPMAKSITKRTLVGYREAAVKAHYFDDLINMLKNKPENFKKSVLKRSYWNKNGGGKMKFDAVVGNPPYQLTDGSGGTNDAPIYQHFVESSQKVTSKYASLIIPSRWFTTGRENLLGDFRAKMLNNPGIRMLFTFTNSRDVFPSVEIKGGLCYYLYDATYSGDCLYTLVQDGQRNALKRRLGDFDILIREPKLAAIVKKISGQIGPKEETVSSLISTDTPFGIPTNPQSSKKNPMKVFPSEGKGHDTKLLYLEKMERKIAYIDGGRITKNAADIYKDKVFVPKAGGSGTDPYVIGKPEYSSPKSVCSQTFLYAAFDSQSEAKNFITYMKTKFFRVLVSACKISQDAPSKAYRFVPKQDFSKPWTDTELYAKYGLTDDEISFIESTIKPMD